MGVPWLLVPCLVSGLSAYNLYDNLNDGSLLGGQLFGWSMVHHHQDLYVGAPLAGEAGKVLRCQSLASKPVCGEGTINPSPSSLLPGAWFGGSLAASRDSLYTCAFRYDWTHWEDHGLQVGKCYKKGIRESRFSDYFDFSNTRFEVSYDPDWMDTGFYGVSATVNIHGNLVVGNPVQYSTKGYDKPSPRYTIGSIGEIKMVNTMRGRILRLFRPRGQVGWARREEYNNFKYAGYDVTAGNNTIIIGAPKADNFRGKVYICTDCFISSAIYREVSGTNIGEHFGSSVAACDFTGDGRDDLVVGAPNFAKDRHSYNSGRVHVFIQQDFDFQRVR